MMTKRHLLVAGLLAFSPLVIALQVQQPGLLSAPTVSGLEHIILHYDKTKYCGHPRMIAFEDFGEGEIVVGHYEAPCKYESYADVRHINYQARAAAILQRSTDGGKTWPKENETQIFDFSTPPPQREAFLKQNRTREPFDMFRPGSMFFFTSTYLVPYPPDGTIPPVTFSLRSSDKGKSWEKTPIIIKNDRDENAIHKHSATPVIRMPDGKTLLTAFQMSPARPQPPRGSEPAIYESTDQGVTWTFRSKPMAGWSGSGHFNYSTLLLMPDGVLHCYMLNINTEDETVEGLKNAISLTTSRDGGRTWSRAAPIVGAGRGSWKNPHGTGFQYRSPWPILLRDGRILVVFARRRMPTGIGGIVSSDGGKTWSKEFVIRDDGQWWDLGYPVGTQLKDGRVFIAYYFPMPDGNKEGGTRHIAGSFFRLDSRQETAARILSPKFFPGWQAQNVSFPFVVDDKRTGHYKMFYAGSGTTYVNDSTWDQWVTGLVTSKDGRTWIYPDNYEAVLFANKFLEGDVVDPAASAGIFDSIFAYGLCVVQDGPLYKGWYTGWNGETRQMGGGLSDKINFRIGYTTSSDGVNWNKTVGSAGGRAVLGPGNADDADSRGAAHPHVLYADGGFRMWYEGYDGTTWRILYATSRDGLNWSNQGVALDLGATNTLDELGLRNPMVLVRGGHYELWYQGQSRSTPQFHVMRARSTDGLTWKKIPGEVHLHPENPVSGNERILVDSAIILPDGRVQVFFAKESITGRQVTYGVVERRNHYIYTQIVNP